MKNILLVDLGKEFGGAEKYVIQVASLLRNRYCFYFLTRNESLLSKKLDELKLGKIIEIEFKISTFLSDINLVSNYLHKYKIDVVHANGINSDFFLALLPKKNNALFVATVHGMAEFDRISKNLIIRKVFSLIETLSLRKFDSIIAVSKSIKNYLVKKQINKSKIVTIYHAIDVNGSLPTYKKHHPLMICYIGRLEKVKNINFLLEALHSIEHIDNIICNIFGTGSELKNLKKLVLQYGLEKCVTFKGYSSDVTQIYRTHDVLVQPSLYEAFGLTIIEAMSNGLPVLCSNVGGMKEIVCNNYNGLLFNVDDLSSLVVLLKEIMDDSINLCYIRENAYKMVREKFCTPVLIHKLCCVYEKRLNEMVDKTGE